MYVELSKQMYIGGRGWKSVEKEELETTQHV